MSRIEQRVIPIDALTGRPVEGSFTIQQTIRARAALHKEGFVMLSQSEQIDALIQAKPGAEAHAVYLVLLTMVDYENWIHVDQGVIARRSAISQPHVSRAIAKLTELGVLIKGPKVGRFGTLRLNPSYGWKGKPHAYSSAVLDFQKARNAQQLDLGL